MHLKNKNNVRSTKTNPQQFKEKVESLGYGIVSDKAEFTVSGMTCAACANRVEKRLNKLDGVNKATVNFALEAPTVDFNPDEVNVNEMKSAITKLGYKLEVKPDDQDASTDHRLQEIERQKKKFIISFILSFPLLWAMVSHFSFTSFIYLPDMLMNPWVQLALATLFNLSLVDSFMLELIKRYVIKVRIWMFSWRLERRPRISIVYI